MNGSIEIDAKGKVNGLDSLRRLARGKVILLGWDMYRVAGVFTSLDNAMKHLFKSADIRKHNWWLSFRKCDRIDVGCVFDRVLLKTTMPRGGAIREFIGEAK